VFGAAGAVVQADVSPEPKEPTQQPQDNELEPIGGARRLLVQYSCCCHFVWLVLVA